MKKNICKSLLALPIFVFSFMLATAVPVPAKFFVNALTADVGQTVEFELKIEGTESVPVYTVIANLEYDKNLLTFKSASTQNGWIPVSPDDVTDVGNGVIKRTAGFPVGSKNLSSIFKYTFEAKAPGDAVVKIVDGSAYDANNNDSGLQNKSITVKIGGKKEVLDEVAPVVEKTVAKVAKIETKKLPQTVTLEFVGQNGFANNKDYTFVLRHNLKVNQETIGSTTLVFFDYTGAEALNHVKDFAITENSEILFTVPANTLAAGNYTIVVTSKYDNQSSKTTTKISKDVGAVEGTKEIVKEEVRVPFVPMYIYYIYGCIAILYILTIFALKSKKFKKFLKNF